MTSLSIPKIRQKALSKLYTKSLTNSENFC